MCRNIRTLFNFEPPATEQEVRASALQFVRKVTDAARRLLDALATASPARNRETEAEKARARARERFA
jgi:hypothetical protein